MPVASYPFAMFFSLVATLLSVPLAAAEIDFARDIRPLLSENCFFCHGPDADQRQADLRLDTEAGSADVVVAGERDKSELFRRLTSSDTDEVMPPPDSNRRLTPQQIELLGRWIDSGARWDEHWAFRPLTRPEFPRIESPAGGAARPSFATRNPIDAFVQAELLRASLYPAPQAERHRLIRRLSLDLTGLPPETDILQRYAQSEDPQWYGQLVEELLNSPAYGERMAWEWLDAARYADTNGYQGDNERTMWPWRDWVVRAFNENMPFDRFTVYQLAGDLLPSATPEQILATGFLRNHMINGEGGRIAEENRIEYVFDMAETTGTVWLGLTFNCCRCHDHKYDPLSNEDYYRFFAYFDQTPVTGKGGDPQMPPNLAFPSREEKRGLLELTEQLQQLSARRYALEADLRSTPYVSHFINLMQESQPLQEASDKNIWDLEQASRRVAKVIKYRQLIAREQTLEKQRQALENRIPKVMVMRDMSQPRQSYMLERGLYNRPQRPVSAAPPKFLPPPASGQPNRLQLAQWLIADENPLTARVTVNRFWQQFFGVGLVKTVEDFGAQGETPVHLDLLNWLAVEFRESGWDVKQLVRTIVTSHTYRQSSRQLDQRASELDPDNRLLWRGARYRLPAWLLRDQALAVGGLLSGVRHGPAVNSYQPAGVWEEATFGKKTYQLGDGEELYRRSLFIFWRRIIAPTIFFDNASRQTCTVKPMRTNTPLHALLTLNDTTYVEAARALAEAALLSGSASDHQRLHWIMLRVLARQATPAESEVLLSGLNRTRAQFAAQPDNATKLVSLGESPRDERLNTGEHASWTALCLAILNLDETLSRE